MRIKYIIFLLSLVIVSFSCKKEEIDPLIVEGTIKDDITGDPIIGISINIDALKSPSSMGIITDGRRKTVGQAITDARGYYKVKLKLFKEAERLEFSLNSGNLKEGYVDTQHIVYLSEINKNGNNKIDFLLSPTGLLQIKFKNVQPASASDFFYFGWFDSGKGVTKGILKKENCGTVAENEAFTWTGKEVCGVYTIETIAEEYVDVYWIVKENGITKRYTDTAYVKRGIINEFTLNY